MRKITILTLLLTVAFAVNSQTNLLVNPSFETWTEGVPTPWYLVSTSVTGSQISKETTIVFDGTSSCKLDASSASGTVNWAQSVTIEPGKSYTLAMSYYIASGDGTDARIWCNFKKSETTYFSEQELVATGLYSKLRGPGNENSSGTAYFEDEKGEWKTYTTAFTAPANAVGFDFQFRTYKGAVVYWDKFSLHEETGSGITKPNLENLNVWTSNGKIHFNAYAGEIIEVYNMMGQKQYNSLAADGQNSISVDIKGVAIVKVGNRVSKVIL